MKVADAKKLIGLRVHWIRSQDRERGQFFLGHGTLAGMQGRNLIFDDGDYRWLPQLESLGICDCHLPPEERRIR